MRPVSFGKPAKLDDSKAFMDWAKQCFADIERASQDDIALIAKDFTLTNVTALRTLDGAAGTLSDVRSVLATFIEDMQKRGMKRSQ